MTGIIQGWKKDEEKIDLKNGHILHFKGSKDGKTNGIRIFIHKK